MQQVPKKIYSIKGIKNIKLYLRYSEDLYLRQHYVIIDNHGKEYEYNPVIKPSRGLIVEYCMINKGKFCNGFRLVRFRNGEFGYIYKSNKHNEYIDYHRYDIATNFNEYGIAMVAKYGTVSFIDTNFNYLKLDEEGHLKMVEEDTSNYLDFSGLYGINNFKFGKAKVKTIQNNIECEEIVNKKLIKKR